MQPVFKIVLEYVDTPEQHSVKPRHAKLYSPIALGQFQTLFNLSALEFPINALKGTGAIGLVRQEVTLDIHHRTL